MLSSAHEKGRADRPGKKRSRTQNKQDPVTRFKEGLKNMLLWTRAVDFKIKKAWSAFGSRPFLVGHQGLEPRTNRL